MNQLYRIPINWTRLASGLALVVVGPLAANGANYQVLGWNNLGMHCMDSDYSVFSVLPPYNTIESQLIAAGSLVTPGTIVPPRSLVVGSPAKVKRELGDEEVEQMRTLAARYVAYRLDYC